jgi:uncharacterized surface protein with fasciclin (FAS1) repeats
MKSPHGLPVTVVALVTLLAAGMLSACGEDQAATVASPSADVVAAAKSDARVSQYAQALVATGLDGEGPYTVFAPSDGAVSKAGTTVTVEDVKASVIDGQELARADLEKGTKNDSMLPDNSIVTYTGSDGSLYVNTYKVVGEPLSSGNGVVYVIDGVIQPK